MPASQAPNFIARGDITPSRFVKQDVASDHGVVMAVAGDEAIGVSHEGTREAPVSGVTPLTAVNGEGVMVYTDTFPCEIVAGGTIVPGDKLVPDADGRAVAAGAGQVYSAIARAGALINQRVKAIVQRGITAGDGVLAAAQQALSGAGAVNVTSFLTLLTFSAVGHALTLANGTFVGQRKKIVVTAITNSGTGILTPTNLAGADTTITFSVVGDCVVLRWNGTAWQIIERYNEATGAATTPVVA